MRRLAATLLVSMTLAACASASSDDPSLRSGVRGVVTAGPQCPVVVQGSPCPDRPWTGTVRITSVEGDTVSEAATGPDGSFSFELEPGRYRVLAVIDGGGPATAASRSIMVDEGAFTEVSLLVDSGIR
jgi:hypothetical protein